MSKTIDQRVVEMKFDNKKFEDGIKESMSTLNQFDKSLNSLGNNSKAFDGINKSIHNLDFNPLQTGLEVAANKFNWLESIAVGALMRIGSKITDYVTNKFNELTIAPVKQGFDEYELKMGAVQTILASTGEDLQTVNGYLEQLNLYADKTIYSFSDMTQNIGKFTNNGVKLDDAVKAIQGVSNAAAVAGANSQEASRAMYNFSQALSQGSVKLIDWKSIQNANMATTDFKQNLIDTAVAMGTLVKQGDQYVSTTTDMNGNVSELFDANKMFNESLSAQWMTTEVLVQTLSNYSTDIREMSDAEREEYESRLKSIGYTEEQIKSIEELGKKAFDAAQDVKTYSQLIDTLKEAVGSGWSQTFEILFGDFEEAKNLWTSINNAISPIIDGMSNARNDMLKEWKDWGGRDDVIKSFSNTWQTISSIIGSVVDAFKDLFALEPVKKFRGAAEAFQSFEISGAADMLLKFSSGLKDLSEKLTPTEETLDKIRRTFRGLFAVLDIVKQAFGALIYAITPAGSVIGDIASKILDGTAAVGDWIYSIDTYLKENNVFINAVDKVKGVLSDFSAFIEPKLQRVKEVFQNVIDTMKAFSEEHFKMPETSLFEGLADRMEERFAPLKSIADFFKGIFSKIGEALSVVAPKIMDAAGRVADGLGAMFSRIVEWVNNANFNAFLDLINTGAFALLAVSLSKVADILGKGAEGEGNFFGLIIDTIKGFLGNKDDIEGFFSSFSESLTNCFKSIEAELKVKTIKDIATALAILAGSVLVLSMIDSEKLAASIAAISVLFVELAGAMKFFDTTMGDGVYQNRWGKMQQFQSPVSNIATAMIEFSAAILILSVAMKKISDIDPERLLGAIAGITVLIVELSAAMMALNATEMKSKTAMSTMMGFALSISILASAMKKIADIDAESFMRATIGITVLIVELTGALMLMSTMEKKVKASAIGMIGMATAVLILAVAMQKIAELDTESLTKGLIAIGVLLAELSLFTVVAGQAKHIISTGIAMIALGAALLIITKAMQQIGAMDISTIGKGLLGIAGALAIIAVAFNVMPKNTVAISIGLIAVGAALEIISDVMMKSAGMSWEEIGKGMVALAGALGILAIALNLMKGTLGAAVSLVVVSGALLVLTASLKALGKMKMAEIAKALGALAGAFIIIGVAGALLGPIAPLLIAMSIAVVAVGAAVLAAGAGLLMFSAALASLAATGTIAVKTIVEMMDILFEGILHSIVNRVELITEAVTSILLSIITAVRTLIPTIVETFLELVESVLKSLSEHVPTIVTYLMDFLIGLINALGDKMPAFIDAIMNFLGRMFEGVVDALNKMDPDTFQNGLLGVGFITALITAMAAVSALVPSAMLGIAGAAGVVTELAAVIAAIGALAQIPGLQFLVDEGGYFLQSIGEAMGKFVGGIAGGFLDGFSDQLPGIGKDLSRFMENIQPFLEGIKSVDLSVLEGTSVMAGVIGLLTASEVINGISQWLLGGTDLGDFGREIATFGKHLKTFAEETEGINGAAVKAAAEAAYAMVDIANAVPNNGGAISLIVGDNLLSDFGNELRPFGKDLAKFADDVTGISATDVRAAAEATSILVTAIANLPNNGGMIAWFTGDNLLSSFGDQLRTYGKDLAKFAEDTAGFDGAQAQAVATATTQWVNALAAMPNQGGVVSWFSGDNLLSALGDQLRSYGKDLAKFSESVVGIQTKPIEDAAHVTKTWIDDISTMPNSGGIVSWFTGDNLLSEFGENLKDYGRCLGKASGYLTGLDEPALRAAADITAVWIQRMSELPNSGGMVSWFTGDNLLGAFGEQLKDYGRYFAKFAEKVNGISVESVQGCMDATATLINTLKDMPNQGGVVAWFTGDNLLDAFGEQLADFGEDFADYASAVEGVPSTITATSTYIANSLKQFAEGMPTTGGLADVIFGEVNLSSLGAELASFGPYFSQYASSIDGVKSNVVTVTGYISAALSDMAANIPKSLSSLDLDKIGSKLKMFGPNVAIFASKTEGINVTTMKQVIEQLGNLAKISNDISGINGDGITKLVTSISEFASEAVETFTTKLGEGCKTIKDKAGEMMQALIDGMNNKKLNVSYIISTICTTVTNEFKSKFDSKDFKNLGSTTVMQSFINGMEAGKLLIPRVVSGIADKIFKEFKNKIDPDDYEQIGKYVIEGLIEGMKDAQGELEKAANKIADTINRATREKLKVKSPSREAEEIGMYWDLGLVKGIEEYTKQVTSSGEILGETAIESMKNSVRKIANLTPDDLEFRPTISPTLDLTEIQNGYAQIGNMFSRELSMGVGIDNAQAATRNLRVTAVNDNSAQMQQNARQLDSINDELRMMRADINGLKDIYDGLQVRMDTGALVGQLVNPLDKAMGYKTIRQSRGRV